jgi:hypothetical protein
MYKKNAVYAAVVAAGYALLVANASLPSTPLTDAQIRARIIEGSIHNYPGNCPCPYSRDAAGRRCGNRSAWSKAGGYTPICYADEISDTQVQAYRNRSGL